MQFQSIDVSNVRNLSSAQLSAESGLNLVYGANGSGKTSLLEAINLLSRARSFRTGRLNDVIRNGEDRFSVTANVVTDDARIVTSGIERQVKQTRIRFAEADIRQVSEQVRNLPVLVLTPESQGLLVDTPKERRRWLDWLMFHVEPDYLVRWGEYQKSLRQRNYLLRNGGRAGEFRPWERRLSELASHIQSHSADRVQRLDGQLKKELEHLLPGMPEAVYACGWNSETPLEEELEQQRDTDRQAGYTRAGPHRADIQFRHEDSNAGQILSRGQGKL
ncbi:MAG: DNA replication and repair protein RecF, partial [Thiotrichales bacterium]|nr:DNA replication and repair protein RecF [Thiotrichales bacterium]